MRVAIYARVSTTDQKPENQLHALREYTNARGHFALFESHRLVVRTPS